MDEDDFINWLNSLEIQTLTEKLKETIIENYYEVTNNFRNN